MKAILRYTWLTSGYKQVAIIAMVSWPCTMRGFLEGCLNDTMGKELKELESFEHIENIGHIPEPSCNSCMGFHTPQKWAKCWYSYRKAPSVISCVTAPSNCRYLHHKSTEFWVLVDIWYMYWLDTETLNINSYESINSILPICCPPVINWFINPMNNIVICVS